MKSYIGDQHRRAESRANPAENRNAPGGKSKATLAWKLPSPLDDHPQNGNQHAGPENDAVRRPTAVMRRYSITTHQDSDGHTESDVRRAFPCRARNSRPYWAKPI